MVLLKNIIFIKSSHFYHWQEHITVNYQKVRKEVQEDKIPQIFISYSWSSDDLVLHDVEFETQIVEELKWGLIMAVGLRQDLSDLKPCLLLCL